jgi:hypothetical protein
MLLNFNNHPSRVSAFASLLTSAVLLTTIGCGTDVSQQTDTVESGGNAVYQAVLQTEQETISNSANQLHGIWWGVAAIDQDSLAQAAAGLTPEQQSALLTQTKAFTSTEMAVHFKPDGTVETAVEVTAPNGQRISGVTTGTWGVVEARGGRFVVETNETDDAGNQSTSQKVFTMVSNNRISLDAPMGDVLSQCKPQIVFERQPTGETNVADAPSSTQTK